MQKKKLPDDLHPDTAERFEKLMRSMAKPAVEKPEEESQASDEATDEGCDDTQTPIDTSEDAS